jgi:hypothetical protein
MATSEHHPGAFAKVSGMSGGLRRDWNQSWTFSLNRDLPEGATCDPMLGVAVIRCVKTGATLRGVDIQNERCSTMKAIERSTLASAPIYSSAKRNREARLRGLLREIPGYVGVFA